MKELIIFLSIAGFASAISGDGGHDSNITRHRFSLSLRENGKHYCGASIISKVWAITSAFCVDGRQPENLSLRGNSSMLTEPDEFAIELKIDYFIKHPKYNKLTQDSDIALLHFAQGLEDDFGYRAWLPFCSECDVSEKATITLTGWGSLTPGGSYPEILQMGICSLIPREQCQSFYPNKLISLNMFCGGQINTTACDGDFGGPARVMSRLEGIISWGSGCGNGKYPNVMTRVAPFVNWITENTGITGYSNSNKPC